MEEVLKGPLRVGIPPSFSLCQAGSLQGQRHVLNIHVSSHDTSWMRGPNQLGGNNAKCDDDLKVCCLNLHLQLYLPVQTRCDASHLPVQT